MKKYRLDLSAHEYHIRRNGLCAPRASSAPFSKLNYLSPVRFAFIPLPSPGLFCIISNRLLSPFTRRGRLANSRDLPRS